MTIRRFVANVQSVTEQAQNNMAAKLAKGQCRNMEEYNRQVGRIEGLDVGLQLIKDMLGQIEDDERAKDLPEMAGGDS